MALSYIRSEVMFLVSFRHVAASLKSLMKGVQTSGEVDEDELDDAVRCAPAAISSSGAHQARI